MAIGDWSEATLAIHSDVTSRFADALDLVAGATDVAKQAVITAYLAKSKDERIGDILTVELRHFIVEMDLDANVDVRDWINNPEVFKYAAVADTLKRIFEDNVQSPDDYHDMMSKKYEAEFKEKMRIAIALVQFDIDNDSELDQEEASGSFVGNKFQRV